MLLKTMVHYFYPIKSEDPMNLFENFGDRAPNRIYDSHILYLILSQNPSDRVNTHGTQLKRKAEHFWFGRSTLVT